MRGQPGDGGESADAINRGHENRHPSSNHFLVEMLFGFFAGGNRHSLIAVKDCRSRGWAIRSLYGFPMRWMVCRRKYQHGT